MWVHARGLPSPQKQSIFYEPKHLEKSAYTRYIKECGKGNAFAKGKWIHSLVVGNCIDQSTLVENHLIDMYKKCGSLGDAETVFDSIFERDVVSWTSMIAGIVQHGSGRAALLVFLEMLSEKVLPNKVTFITILDTIKGPDAFAQGKRIHSFVILFELELQISVASGLISMYGNCGGIEVAQRLFDSIQDKDTVLWTSLMSAYVHHGYEEEVVELFQQMKLTTQKPDRCTLVVVLGVYASLTNVSEGVLLHSHVLLSRLQADIFVGSSLISMYASCGNIEIAKKAFDDIHPKNVVVWTAMLDAYHKYGHNKAALMLIQQMKCAGVMPDKITYLSILEVCATMAALVEGHIAHACIYANDLASDLLIGPALINMYGRFGILKDANTSFDSIQSQNLVSWNALIGAYAQHGYFCGAQLLFQKMQQSGLMPDNVTFVCILSVYSHAGLIGDGYHSFLSMVGDVGILATQEHYGCMVSLLGQVGWIDEAENFISSEPFLPDLVSWTILLCACRNHGDLSHGKRVANQVIQLDPCNDAAHIMLSNIYAACLDED